MNILPAIISLLLFTLARSQDACAACASSTAPKGTCYSDGQLYASDACAQCVNHDNFAAFRCPDDPNVNCAATCAEQLRIYRCRAACTEPYVYSFTCNSNGRVYSNRCREQCIEPGFTDVFRCNQFTRFSNGDCNLKCAKHFDCLLQTQDLPLRSVCGKDGLLYRNFEEAQCNGSYIPITDAEGKPVYEGTDNCRDYVELRYGEAVGARPRTVFFPISTHPN